MVAGRAYEEDHGRLRKVEHCQPASRGKTERRMVMWTTASAAPDRLRRWCVVNRQPLTEAHRVATVPV